MQFRALFSATCELMKEGYKPMLEIMVPLTINAAELRHQKAIANAVKDEVEKKYGIKFDYKFGTMIEIPRAALMANQIAEVAESFYKAGMNYVSCSPFRVPVARLAAAQAAIKESREK